MKRMPKQERNTSFPININIGLSLALVAYPWLGPATGYGGYHTKRSPRLTAIQTG